MQNSNQLRVTTAGPGHWCSVAGSAGRAVSMCNGCQSGITQIRPEITNKVSPAAAGPSHDIQQH